MIASVTGKPFTSNFCIIKKNDKCLKSEQKENCTFDFVGFQVGQSLKAYNGIGFENSKEIDISQMKSLDLSNIEVYKTPNTNFELVVNSDDKLIDSKVFVTVKNNNFGTPLQQAMLKTLINQRLTPKLYNEVSLNRGLEIDYNEDRNFSLNRIPDINKKIFVSNFDDIEIERAKFLLKNQYYNKNYQNNLALVKSVYPKEAFLSEEEFNIALDNINADGMNVFYKEFLKSSKLTMYLIASKKLVTKDLLFSVNKNIPMTNESLFSNTGSNVDFKKFEEPIIVTDENLKNSKFRYIYSEDGNNYYKGIIVAELLGNASSSSISLPMSLKADVEPLNLGYIDILSSGVSKLKEESINASKESIANILEAPNLEQKIDEIKVSLKKSLKHDLVDSAISFDRCQSFLKTPEDMYSIYEIIDSITDDEIKLFIEKYILSSVPMVLIKEDDNENL